MGCERRKNGEHSFRLATSRVAVALVEKQAGRTRRLTGLDERSDLIYLLYIHDVFGLPRPRGAAEQVGAETRLFAATKLCDTALVWPNAGGGGA